VSADDPVVRRAAEIADTLLFPAALAVDAADRVPASHLDLLAGQGFYGMFAPEEDGGAGVDFPTACAVVAAFAGGCLATTFVWAQHQGVVRRVVAAGRRDLLGPLCAGTRRAGVALGGTRPDAPLRARHVDGGYEITGSSPWVSGWGMIDTLLLAARTEEDDALVWALVDAETGPHLRVEAQRMVAVNASGTVTAHFAGLPVRDDAVLAVQRYADFEAADAGTIRFNGSLSVGLIGRCVALLGPSALNFQLDAVRAALLDAPNEDLPKVRATAAELAVRSATALLVHTGSRAIRADSHPQRLAREAQFLTVFGTRPAIRAELETALTTPR
jgi:alkylation response protein AidB-like acyl-CoA dehydrogenase